MFTIRVATPRDIGPVDDLLRRSYPRLLRNDYAPSMLVTVLPRIARAQPRLVAGGTYYLAEDDGALMGAGGWTPGQGAAACDVRHLAVDHSFTRRGVGRALLEHAMEEARKDGRRRMTALSTLTAVPFYRACGFQPVAERILDFGVAAHFPVVEMRRSL